MEIKKFLCLFLKFIRCVRPISREIVAESCCQIDSNDDDDDYANFTPKFSRRRREWQESSPIGVEEKKYV